MNSLLYKHLKDKVNNDNTKNNTVFFDKKAIKFDEFDKMVTNYIDFFKKNPLKDNIY